jgi:hypothetical protein
VFSFEKHGSEEGNMSFKTNTDNLYSEGTVLAAKVDPTRQLKIKRYYQRIYYCTAVGDESQKLLVYFERELMPVA